MVDFGTNPLMTSICKLYSKKTPNGSLESVHINLYNNTEAPGYSDVFSSKCCTQPLVGLRDDLRYIVSRTMKPRVPTLSTSTYLPMLVQLNC